METAQKMNMPYSAYRAMTVLRMAGVGPTPEFIAEKQPGNLKSATNKPQNRNKEVWKMYPNPAMDMITIEWTAGYFYGLEIVDAKGRLVTQQRTKAHQVVLDLSDQPAGLYLVRLFAVDGRPLGNSTFIKQ